MGVVADGAIKVYCGPWKMGFHRRLWHPTPEIANSAATAVI